MSEVTYYTQEGLDKLKEELHKLKTVDRAAISKQIAEARDKGDLSENAEYDAAKEAQGMHEAKNAKSRSHSRRQQRRQLAAATTPNLIIPPTAMATSYPYPPRNMPVPGGPGATHQGPPGAPPGSHPVGPPAAGGGG